MYGVIDVPKAVPIHLHTPYQRACPSCVVAGKQVIVPSVLMSGSGPLPFFKGSRV
jgi:hypothetical protein